MKIKKNFSLFDVIKITRSTFIKSDYALYYRSIVAIVAMFIYGYYDIIKAFSVAILMIVALDVIEQLKYYICDKVYDEFFDQNTFDNIVEIYSKEFEKKGFPKEYYSTEFIALSQYLNSKDYKNVWFTLESMESKLKFKLERKNDEVEGLQQGQLSELSRGSGFAAKES